MTRKSQYTPEQQWIMKQLRQLSIEWPEKNKALVAARVAPNKYQCAECKQVFGRFALKADHIEPVVAPEVGFVSIGEYAERLFCSADNYQMLCKPCHDFRSKKENALRRRKKKALGKE